MSHTISHQRNRMSLEASCDLATTEAKLEFERQRRSDAEAVWGVGSDGKPWENHGKMVV